MEVHVHVCAIREESEGRGTKQVDSGQGSTKKACGNEKCDQRKEKQSSLQHPT